MADLTYRAFLSYSHRDTEAAEHWHARLQAFPIHDPFRRMPTKLGLVPDTVGPIFRDRVHFPGGAELPEATRQALDQSMALVLLASPTAAASEYVNEEVRYFRWKYPDRPLVPVVIGPDGVESAVMFPRALAFRLDEDGAITNEPRKVIAVDPRPGKDGAVIGTARIIGRLVGFDDHWLGQFVEDAERRDREARAEADLAEQRHREQLAAIERASQDAERRHAEAMGAQKRIEDLTRSLAGEGPAAMAAVTEFRALLRPFHPEIDSIPVGKLATLAQGILETLRKPGADPNDFAGAVREALRLAQDHINKLDFAGAAHVLDAELVRSEAQARVRAALLAERGRVARLQIRYRDAARFYAQARGAVDGIDDGAVWEYITAQVSTLNAQGKEFGDNSALRDAINVSDIAVRMAARSRRSREWAQAQVGRAIALSVLGERETGAKRLEEAVIAFRSVRDGFIRQREPLDWAVAQHNLGSTLRILGERASDTTLLNESIFTLRAALLERTRERVPLDWAGTQNNLGLALWTLGEIELSDARLEEAVTAFNAALSERTRARAPLDWAMTQNNLGNALLRLWDLDKNPARLAKAVIAFREALKEHTRARVPLEWAMTQNNLGNALRAIGEREGSKGRLQEAATAYRNALEEWTRDRTPSYWATAQNNLGTALSQLGERDGSSVSLRESITAYRAALEEWTPDGTPLHWAGASFNLSWALALLGSRTRDRALLEEAIRYVRDAVIIFRKHGVSIMLQSALRRVDQLEAMRAAWPAS